MVSSPLSLFAEASTAVEQAAAPTPTFGENIAAYFQTMFKKIGGIPLPTWIVLITLCALGILFLLLSRKKQNWNARIIAYAALAITLSFLLSHIRLYRMPQGGSITPASMLPLMLFSYTFGLTPGLLAGVAYGVLEFLQDPVMLPIAPLYAFCQVALDYLLAFGCIGFSALFAGRKEKDSLRLPIGIGVVSFLRFFCSVLSGVLFFGEYAGDQNPWVYSILYNGSYMLPEMIICIALGIAIGPRLCRTMGKSVNFR